jgi:hypothetical protein
VAQAVELQLYKGKIQSWAWWGTPTIEIPKLRRWRQEDLELETSLGCTVSSKAVWTTQ